MAEGKPNGLDRHCAFCLKFLPAGTVKLCSKCHRRAYCSRDCQKADWIQKEGSQGHRNWCDLGCGEEDIDWEVEPIPGKGLGIIAKRLIPTKYRIMVDAPRQHSYLAIMDLAPIGGTLEEKIALNKLEGDSKPNVCLRISRVNHDCDRNACHFNDSDRKVKILFSEREIQPGEEITICYTLFNEVYYSKITSTMARTMLQQRWGIVCNVDCFCRNEEVQKLVQESRVLDEEISKALSVNNASGAMQMIKRLLENHSAMHSSWITIDRTLNVAFQIGIMRQSTMDEGKEFLRRAYEIRISMCHPLSKEVLEMEKYMKNPSSHSAYRRCDR